jgi:hypothetical protein
MGLNGFVVLVAENKGESGKKVPGLEGSCSRPKTSRWKVPNCLPAESLGSDRGRPSNDVQASRHRFLREGSRAEDQVSTVSPRATSVKMHSEKIRKWLGVRYCRVNGEANVN